MTKVGNAAMLTFKPTLGDPGISDQTMTIRITGPRRMIAIATTGRNRANQLPNVPTVIESGLPDYDVTSWNALAAPSDTSDDIVFILNRAVAEALKSPEVQHYFNEIGIDAHGMSSKELAELIRTDVAKWSQVIEKAGIEK